MAEGASACLAFSRAVERAGPGVGMLEIREKMASMQEACGLKEGVVVVGVGGGGDAGIPVGKGTQLALKVVMAPVLVVRRVQGLEAPVLAAGIVRGCGRSRPWSLFSLRTMMSVSMMAAAASW